MNILKNYLPTDLVNMIYDYVYRSVYHDVLEEMDKETWIVEIGPNNALINIDELLYEKWFYYIG